MMGLTDWVYWIGTFASGFLVMAVTSVISLVLFKIEVAPLAAVLLYSDFSLLLFIMLLYATGAILFLLLFTIIFNNGNRLFLPDHLGGHSTCSLGHTVSL